MKVLIFIVIAAFHLAESSGPNVALNKKVSGINLSSGTEHTYRYLDDGDSNTCADSGVKVESPGFMIDLGEPFLVSSVNLIFPDNCDNTVSQRGCGYKDIEIHVGDSPNHFANQECASFDIRDPPKTMALDCHNIPTVGRYVSVVKLTPNYIRAIYLCELEVYGEPVIPPTEAPPTEAPPTEAPPTEAPGIQTTHIPTQPPCEYPVPIADVARGKPATQSSDKPRKDGGAEKAVDGNRNGDLKKGNSCTWSDREYQPWWMVDLLESKNVYEVRIYNREDCCSHRIKNAQIRVGDSANFEDNPICGIMILGKMSREKPIVIRCGCETPMRGRYVSLQLIDKEQMLTICEFEVMAG
ncbi:uncharacterized protein [Ptychodera flava]|uniref:uncharacterized protein n=1 Tax=Ptychodera flava TaxID=63121 RepID=UPI00396A6C5B